MQFPIVEPPKANCFVDRFPEVHWRPVSGIRKVPDRNLKRTNNQHVSLEHYPRTTFRCPGSIVYLAYRLQGDRPPCTCTLLLTFI